MFKHCYIFNHNMNETNEKVLYHNIGQLVLLFKISNFLQNKDYPIFFYFSLKKNNFTLIA